MNALPPRPMIVLHTPRLSLRHLEPADLDDLCRLYSDPEVRRYIPEGVLTRDQTRAELDWHLHGHPDTPELGLWATTLRSDGAFIGRCGLLRWTLEGRDETEVAYMISRSHWGRGLATEAAAAIADHAFTTLRLARVTSRVTPGNTASERVATKIGMSLEREFVDEFGAAWLYAMSAPVTVTRAR